MLLTLFQNNLNSFSTAGTLKKWNGTAWVIHRITNYNGIDVRTKEIYLYSVAEGQWKKITQA